MKQPRSCALLLLACLLPACGQDADTTEQTVEPTAAQAVGEATPATVPTMDRVISNPRPESPFEAGAPPPQREPDVIYVPTPQPVVDAMLRLAEAGPGDVLYDLGSGDGRIPVTAARMHGIRAVGIEIDPALIREAEANAREAGVGDLVEFREDDMFLTDISQASVVTLYLLQSLNVKLRPKLLSELRPGTRIVSHAFSMADEWEPEQTEEVGDSVIYRWTVPDR